MLVTGGNGYIGSHVVQQLRESGERVVVLDNLSTGFRQGVGDRPLVIGDVENTALVDRLLEEYAVGAIMCFAGPGNVRQASGTRFSP